MLGIGWISVESTVILLLALLYGCLIFQWPDALLYDTLKPSATPWFMKQRVLDIAVHGIAGARLMTLTMRAFFLSDFQFYPSIPFEFSRQPITILDERWFFTVLYAFYLASVFRSLKFVRRQDRLRLSVQQDGLQPWYMVLRHRLPAAVKHSALLTLKASRYFLLAYFLLGGRWFQAALRMHAVLFRMPSLKRELIEEYRVHLFHIFPLLRTLFLGVVTMAAWTLVSEVFHALFEQVVLISDRQKNSWARKSLRSLLVLVPYAYRRNVEPWVMPQRTVADMIKGLQASHSLVRLYAYAELVHVACDDNGEQRAEIYVRSEWWDAILKDALGIMQGFEQRLSSMKSRTVSTTQAQHKNIFEVSKVPSLSQLIKKDETVADANVPDILLSRRQREQRQRRAAPAAFKPTLPSKAAPLSDKAEAPAATFWRRTGNAFLDYIGRFAVGHRLLAYRDRQKQVIISVEGSLSLMFAMELLVQLLLAAADEDGKGFVKEDAQTVLKALLDLDYALDACLRDSDPEWRRRYQQDSKTLMHDIERMTAAVLSAYASVVDQWTLTSQHVKQIQRIVAEHPMMEE